MWMSSVVRFEIEEIKIDKPIVIDKYIRERF